MRSETITLLTHGICGLGNVEVYSLHDVEWRNVCVSMKDKFDHGKPRPDSDFDDVILAVHKDTLAEVDELFLVELPFGDAAPGISRELKKADLDHIFVFETFLRSVKSYSGRYGKYNFEWKDDVDINNAFFERGYSPAFQPNTRWVAFKTETDAVAAQGVISMYQDDDFARAS